MSKIEKALNRARSISLTPVPVSQPESGQQLVRAPVAGGVVADPEQRARSAQAIARMREPTPRSRTELEQRRVVFPEMTDSDTVKALREIRTKITQKTEGNNGVVLVTSLAPRGGGSFIAFNLAAAFAFDAGRTALLVDCNLRNSSLPRLFADTPHLGLTDYLEDSSIAVGDVIHPIGIERLRVIPAGGRREVPGEYFDAARMQRLIEELRSRYPERFVILDAPPTTESADVHTLAGLCDWVIVVVPYGKVTTAQIEEALKSLPQEKVLGVVFNNEPGLPPLSWRSLVGQTLVWMREWFAARLRRKPVAG
jgi:capsular exopolysaccharide synthesis family protein